MFKVGDEVVCVDAKAAVPAGAILPNGCRSKGDTGLSVGKTYTVIRIGITMCGEFGLDVGFGPKSGPHAGFSKASRFRKVQRRDLSVWLETAVKVPHLDKRKVNA